MRNLLLTLFGRQLNKPISKHIAQTRLLHFNGINVGRKNGKIVL